MAGRSHNPWREVSINAWCGKPHARFDVAEPGNGAAEVSARHRVSSRPYRLHGTPLRRS